MLGALAHFATSRPRRVVVAVAATSVVAAVLGVPVASKLAPYGDDDPSTQSVQATKLYERAADRDPDAEAVAVVATPTGVGSAAERARVERLAHELRGDPAVVRVLTWYGTHDPGMVARDGRSTFAAAYFRPSPDSQRMKAASRLERRLRGQRGVELGGRAVAEQQVNETVSRDLRRAEIIAFPAILALSLVFFRGLVAAALPPLLGGLAIVWTFLGLRLVNDLTSVSVFALNLTTGMGLGLAIDYSLFIVSRYREELAQGRAPAAAARATLRTAGRTVLFSSLTVAAAASALLIFPQRFLYSMGIGGVMVTLFAAAAALVFLPALLLLLGERVNALAPRWLQRAAARDARPAQAGAWYRLSRFVMRRPIPVATASAALLIALGVPFLGIRFTGVDATVLPKSASAHRAASSLRSRFPPSRGSPTQVVVREGASGSGTHVLAHQLARLPDVASVAAPEPLDATTSLVQVYPRAGPLTGTTKRLVTRIRSLSAGARVAVRGETAHFVDLHASLARHLPYAFAIVLATTLVILFLFTGSLVLPFKAALMSLLTLSAAFGALVLVFQDGHLQSLLAYTSQGALDQTQPILLFALAFGLTTDYGVFLLSRIKEARDRGASDREAVALGLERTGRIVTAAALLFCVAIGAFATSRIVFIKEVGLGTALAVLLDATLVRALLVPSLMELLGRANWWAPRPLRALHRRIGLEEAARAEHQRDRAPADSASAGAHAA